MYTKVGSGNLLGNLVIPSCFHCKRYWFAGEDLWYNDQSITTPHNIALEKVNGGLWNYFGGFDYYYKAGLDFKIHFIHICIMII